MCEKPRYKLYHPSVIGLASILGVLIGGILLSVNYHRIRKPFLVVATLVLSLLAQIVIVWMLVFFFPGSDNPMPGLVSFVLSPIIMYGVSSQLQDRIIQAHLDAGGNVVRFKLNLGDLWPFWG